MKLPTFALLSLVPMLAHAAPNAARMIAVVTYRSDTNTLTVGAPEPFLVPLDKRVLSVPPLSPLTLRGATDGPLPASDPST